MHRTFATTAALALLAAAPQAFAQDTTVTIDAGQPGAPSVLYAAYVSTEGSPTQEAMEGKLGLLLGDMQVKEH